MSKKFLSVGFALALLLVAVPAFSSLQCTIQCLGENLTCDEGPTVCAVLFDICMDICDDPIIFQAVGMQTTMENAADTYVDLDFLQSEPLLTSAEPVACTPMNP